MTQMTLGGVPVNSEAELQRVMRDQAREDVQRFRSQPTPFEATLPIRGLTLWRPWPWSMHGRINIVGDKQEFTPGPKRIENRRWHIPREMLGKCFVAIQSGQTFDNGAVKFLEKRGWYDPGPAYPSDCITGVAFIANEYGNCERGCNRCRSPIDSRAPLKADPFYMGAVAHEWTGRVPLIRPVPCKGRQGYFRLPPAVERQVRESYAETIAAIGSMLEPGPRLSATMPSERAE